MVFPGFLVVAAVALLFELRIGIGAVLKRQV